jgi:quercetin dioxygenase-like cupin family protein
MPARGPAATIAAMADLQLTVVADRDTFAVVEFEGERGAGLPAHVHAFEDEWLLVISGQLELRLDRELSLLTPAEPVLLPLGVPHAVTIASQRAHYLALWRPGSPGLLRTLADPVPDPDDLAALLAGAGVTLL